ncbi:monovalent cation:proton antiporter-2 (CPA2) family protein [Xanthobacter tagetidis]|jgi:glutathione-regulated potassium-efflux system protein KefB|uniref:Potassium transporter TrkA n=1 Tax=Xanthobacter tagetidis TaxID=60216 RepID=A0A3L7ANH7_9HYPH|nr:monovalent cation:proton antiporter-2 (CPA2) family protein [Xanthobacter tagetidis]MBB6307639.1 glutathione-regulated potassium-efflux system protein KefB [Xanthobacter tagetidis]RLP81200.1 potassium transporter TrkA [Xanthobacter tagetidis]
MHGEDHELFIAALAFLSAAVIAVPVARRLGFSPVVGYLLVGIAIGPVGFNVANPTVVSTVAELGVVMLLFLIGIELKPSHILSMSRYIFGLGAAQLAVTTALFAALAVFGLGFGLAAAVVSGVALSISGTAIALQLLGERGDLAAPYGQRSFSVLLFQDMAVVPLLALVPLLAPGSEEAAAADPTATVLQALGAAAAIGIIVVFGRFLINPLFRVLARSGAREAMTAAALLVVLGAAGLMQLAGMSMALGAFLAGLLLSESTFRHEIEANLDGFRGLLLALFFMSVGMSLNLVVVGEHVGALLIATLAVVGIKSVVVYGVFRHDDIAPAESLLAAVALTPAGEFAFVLFPLALATGILRGPQADLLIALAALTMIAGPLLFALVGRLAPKIARRTGPPEPEPDDFTEADGSVLVIGFGRFGQIVAQCLLAEGVSVTIIDNDVEMIQSAGRFGVHIYYGDGTRLDVLRAAGAEQVEVICVCVDDKEDANRIVDIVRSSIPSARLYVRAFDRVHSMDLLRKGVDFEIRETLESALAFGGRTLEALGVAAPAAAARIADVRVRDHRRLERQLEEGIFATDDLWTKRKVEPEPLTAPEKPARPINPEAQDILTHETEFSG